MLVNASQAGEVRVAVVSDSRLTGLLIDSSSQAETKGNIYKGVIARFEPSLEAYFVDFGHERNGFLPVNDLNPAYLPAGFDPKHQRLAKGQTIPVQVARSEKGRKGALLTMNLSIPGSYLVLMPHQATLKGISRKIEANEQRQQLKAAISELELPAGMGLIVRTAGIDRSQTELSQDLDYLLRLWNQFVADYQNLKAPALIYRESDVVIKALRDYNTSEIDEILVDDSATADRIRAFLTHTATRRRKDPVKLAGDKPIFSKYELERQIEAIFEREVRLPSGGYLVIEQTEALVAIDVNSGQATASDDVAATAFSTNLEAAVEVARQLILRDLGGLIVVDFIDMHDREHVRKVERAIKDALKPDRAHLVLGRISSFGLFEMSRERLAPSLMEKSHRPCPTCQGKGLVRSPESSASMVLRAVHGALAKDGGACPRLRLEVGQSLADELRNNQHERLLQLELNYGAKIQIETVTALPPSEFNIVVG